MALLWFSVRFNGQIWNMAIFQITWENLWLVFPGCCFHGGVLFVLWSLKPNSWGRRMSAECLCLLPSSGEMKIVWHSWGLSHSPRCAGCQGLGYLSLYVLEELKRFSKDWRAARLLGNQECQHTALELALHCYWQENCSTSPYNGRFMGLPFTMEKVRWYLLTFRSWGSFWRWDGLRLREILAFSCHPAC